MLGARRHRRPARRQSGSSSNPNRNSCTGRMQQGAYCRPDVTNHDGDCRSRPLPASPVRQSRSAAPGASAARSGPLISAPSSISLPGLTCSRHPGSGPHDPRIAIAVPNKRLIIHGEGFNFLTFASSLHADWTIGGRKQGIVSFFSSRALIMPQPRVVVLTKPCNFCICVQDNQFRSPLDAQTYWRTVVLRQFNSYYCLIPLFLRLS